MSTTLEPVREVDPLELIPTLPEEPTLPTRKEILLRAAELIEEKGWVQNRLGGDFRGGYCILGAVSRAAGIWSGSPIKWDGDQGWATTYTLLGRTPDLIVNQRTIADWNDEVLEGHWGHVRVLAALRRLANDATWDEAIS